MGPAYAPEHVEQYLRPYQMLGGGGHLHRRLLSSTDGLSEFGRVGQQKIHQIPCCRKRQNPQQGSPINGVKQACASPWEHSHIHLPHEHEEEAGSGHESSPAGR